MINQSDIEKLERFSKGLSDAEEQKYIYTLFSENEGNRKFKHFIRTEFNDYLKSHPEEDYNLSGLLDRIHHIIHKNENRKKHTVVQRIYRWYSVAAAVLLIPLLIAGGIWLTGQLQNGQVAESPVTSTLFAPLGSRISFSLPDGTKGWLNSGSSLEYSLPFNYNRQVAVKGEAWFDVAHDESHPFEVTAGRSKVKVLGTKFNLNAYPQDNYTEVVLEEGKVEFSSPFIAKSVKMQPNERLILKDKDAFIEITEASKYAAWKEGKLVFRGDPMVEVARRIERWYNVKVELVDKDLETFVFRGTFQDDSLEEVFRYLSMTSPIRYRILEREIADDGTVQQKKVLLYRKK